MLAASLLAVLLATSPVAARAIGGHDGPTGPERAEVAGGWMRWDAPLGCPGAEWLMTRVEGYLGRPLAVDELEAASARGLGGQVRIGSHGRFELELYVGDAAELRHQVGDHDCRRLVDTAASLLAIAIDPLALGRSVVPLEQAEPPIPVPLELPAVAVERPVDVARSRATSEPVSWELIPVADRGEGQLDRSESPPSGRWRGVLATDAGLALGVFPNLAPRVHGRLGFELREPEARVGLRLELDGGATLAGRFRASDEREIGGDLMAWDLALRPCAVPRWGRVDLRTCIAVGAGQLRGRGVGVVNSQQVAQPWLWAGADVGVAVALLGRDARRRISVALAVDAGAGVNMLRPNFVILDALGGPDVGYVMPVVSGRGRLGIELGFF